MPPPPTPLHLTRLPTRLTLHHPLPPALRPRHLAPPTSPISTTAIGTNYERLALLALQPLAFELRHVGGRADRGIDLIGRWRLPSCLHREDDDDDGGRGGAIESPRIQAPRLDIPVIAQCKGHQSTPHPAWVRELEGAVAAAPPEWRDGVGVLISKGKATPGVRQAVMGARRGLVWVQMMGEGVGGGEGRVGQVLWNKWVGELVGAGVGVGLVYRPMGGGKVEGELRLMYEGKVWEPEPGM